MSHSNRIVFELNRLQILPFVAGSLVFVVLSAWFLWMDPEAIRGTGGRYADPVEIYLMSAAGVLFFGAIFISAGIKLFGRKEGVIVDEQGITDNSSGVAAGFIPWADVKRLRIHKGFLVVDLVNPAAYAKRGWPPRRLAYRLNQYFYNSPVVISDKVLNGSVRDILVAAESLRRR